MKKSFYKKLFENAILGRKNDLTIPRRLTLEELQKLVEAEFSKGQEVEKVQAKEGDWNELEHEVDWLKILKIKE